MTVHSALTRKFEVCAAPNCLEMARDGYCSKCAPKYGAEAARLSVSRYREQSNLDERVRALSSGASFLYCMRAGEWLKFGVARNVKQRVRELQCGSPISIELLAAMRCVRRLEKDLHIRLAADRVRGEWFSQSPDTLMFLDIIKSNDMFRLQQELSAR